MVIREISDAMGTFGVIGGQTVDIQPYKEKPKVEILEYISTHKTAALIRASVRSGAILGDADEDELSALTEYGENIGTAFQIVDDILDEVKDRCAGESSSGDGENGRLNYVSFFGLERSRRLAREKTEKGIAALERLGMDIELLRALAAFMVDRGY